MSDLKWCPHCQAMKPLTDFYPSRSTASGVDGYCKAYRREAQRLRSRASRAARRDEQAASGVRPGNRPWRIDDAGRECAKCGSYQVWAEFHLDRKSKTGHQSKCKACVRARQREVSSTEEGRAASRRRTAEHRARTRAPDWQPRQVTRHAQLDCDGKAHVCTQCGERKTVADFPRNAGTPCGFDPCCSDCRHKRRVERRRLNHNNIRDRENLHWSVSRQGISGEEYLWLLEKQGGVCALCATAELFHDGAVVGKKRLSVDHDHEHCPPTKGCKKCIRGLLCHGCNVGLGMFEGKAATRYRFADYLAKRPFA